MLVKDYGEGIPRETLDNFENNGTQVGVGLAGIRERVMEFGGKWGIKSDGAGTEIKVAIPLVSSTGAHHERHQQVDSVAVD